MRRLAVGATTLASALIGLPATVAADCNGPDCDGVAPPVDSLVIVLMLAIMVVFLAAMAAAEARRR